MSKAPRYSLFTLLCALPFLMAHGGGCGSDDDGEIFGPPTETTCPEISTLTYGTFGQQFMEAYCIGCHSSQLKGAARNGAPEYHDFDTLPGIRSVSDHIDQTTAVGPAASNLVMPPGGTKPTEEERRRLGEWIACGAP
jgi:uncharacterized membrane protein